MGGLSRIYNHIISCLFTRTLVSLRGVNARLPATRDAPARARL